MPLALGPAVGTEPSATPEAGRAATQPAPVVRRLGQAVFAWQGGHPSIDAPRGRPFVSLQRRGEDGEWATVATDDSFFDTTERSPEDLWSERFQFDECAPTGLHRFLVTGSADRRAGGPVPYELSSAPFRVEVASIKAAEPVVAGGRASVTATYPDPGKEILLALPRRVRSGHAVLDVTHRGRTTRVRAGLDPARLAFVADVPAGAGVRVVEVRDGCGNHGR